LFDSLSWLAFALPLESEFVLSPPEAAAAAAAALSAAEAAAAAAAPVSPSAAAAAEEHSNPANTEVRSLAVPGHRRMVGEQKRLLTRWIHLPLQTESVRALNVAGFRVSGLPA
jgi:hypothetical protein